MGRNWCSYRLSLACEVAKVAVNTRHGWRNSKKPLIELRRRVVEAFSVVGEVSNKETWVALVGVALDNFGKVTTLVHNATHSYTKPATQE